MIEGVMSALPNDHFPTLVGAGGADDRGPRGPRQLHRGYTHASARTVDENGLSRTGPGAHKETVVRRGVSDIHRCALGIRDPLRQRVHLRPGTKGQLPIGTSE